LLEASPHHGGGLFEQGEHVVKLLKRCYFLFD
jgi:hypothetical protein